MAEKRTRKRLLENRKMLSIYVSETEKEKLDLYAHEEGMSTSHLVRKLISEHIRSKENS